jgi:hypothetical protein
MSTPADTTHYRLAPPMTARFVGAYLLLLAMVMLVTSAVVGVAGLNADLLVLLLGLGLLGLIGLAWWLRSRLAVVTLTAAGYRVRLVRGAGVHEARWSEVEDAVAATPRDIPCVVLRLKDGRSTTIPVEVLAVDRDEFARDVRARLTASAR